MAKHKHSKPIRWGRREKPPRETIPVESFHIGGTEEEVRDVATKILRLKLRGYRPRDISGYSISVEKVDSNHFIGRGTATVTKR